MSQDLPVRRGLRLPADELRLSFSRSSGPGGQNVNKVNTRVELRFHVPSSPTLGPRQKSRILARLASRITRDGDLVVFSEKTRHRHRNIEDAREKLRRLLDQALQRDKPRVPTRVPRAERRKRVEDKRRKGRKKDLRKPPPYPG